MLERNRYMVNNSSLLIALFNGKPGGTKSTIEYAKKQNLRIIVITSNERKIPTKNEQDKARRSPLE